MKPAGANTVSFEEEHVLWKSSQDDQPHIKRRAGLIPLQVPVTTRNKSP